MQKLRQIEQLKQQQAEGKQLQANQVHSFHQHRWI